MSQWGTRWWRSVRASGRSPRPAGRRCRPRRRRRARRRTGTLGMRNSRSRTSAAKAVGLGVSSCCSRIAQLAALGLAAPRPRPGRPGRRRRRPRLDSDLIWARSSSRSAAELALACVELADRSSRRPRIDHRAGPGAADTASRSVRMRRMSSTAARYQAGVSRLDRVPPLGSDLATAVASPPVSTPLPDPDANLVPRRIPASGPPSRCATWSSATAIGWRSIGLSFEVAAGTVTALLGPNGAGKTSTVESLEGYRRPRRTGAGAGARPRRRPRQLDPAHRRDAAERRRLHRHPAARGAALFASYYDDPADPDELLERVGPRRAPTVDLEAPLGRRAATPVPGPRPRGPARGGVPRRAHRRHRPQRPPADPTRRSPTCAQSGVTVLLTTHDLEEAEKLADRVVIIDQGRVLAAGTPDGADPPAASATSSASAPPRGSTSSPWARRSTPRSTEVVARRVPGGRRS